MRWIATIAVTLAFVAAIATQGDNPPGVAELPQFDAPDVSNIAPLPIARIVDGDTIVVSDAGEFVTVRLVGVDTPETVHPTKQVEQYGKEASQFTTNLLKGEHVWLVSDDTGDKIDKYGRVLAYVYRAPDGLFVNAEIIRQGYGHAYTAFPFDYIDEFRQLERFARQSEKGLWSVEVAVVAPPARAPPTTVVPVEKQDVAAVTVYTTRTGTKYHRQGCRHLERSSIPMPLSQAKARYGPCSVCKPPVQE